MSISSLSTITHTQRQKTMKTSIKTKTARIVIGELPSASNASNPLNLHSAAVVASVVASVRGGAMAATINPFPNPFQTTVSIPPGLGSPLRFRRWWFSGRLLRLCYAACWLLVESYYNPFVPNVPKWSKAFWNVFFSLASSPVITWHRPNPNTWHRPLPNVPKAP